MHSALSYQDGVTDLRNGSSSTLDLSTDIVDAALRLARAFVAGGRLVVRADECADHAHHVAVEFIHPVIAGAQSLPSLAVDGNFTLRAADCLLIIGDDADGNIDFSIPSRLTDAEIMLSYHVLWELVQVCLEHPGIVGAQASAGGDSTGFLYPFLDASETDEGSLRAALESSAAAKRIESQTIAAEAVRRNRVMIDEAAAAIVASAARGGRVLLMGNGGSSTDAARIERLLAALGIDALSIASDYAVLSALANDLGADRVFARQIEALARPGDVLIGCSTSGASQNLLAAFEQANAGHIVGIGISGYGGGSFRQQRGVTHCLAVESTSVHRIQEAQCELIAELCDSVGRAQVADSADDKRSDVP
jgi:D-sedoheptulose 7-phosphate isomerase